MSEISIQWRQDYEFLDCAEADSKPKKLDTPVWHPFDMDDILFRGRNYAMSLFSNGPPMVIKENNSYIVNRSELLDQYKKAGKQAKLLSDCTPSSAPVIDVGFWL